MSERIGETLVLNTTHHHGTALQWLTVRVGITWNARCLRTDLEVAMGILDRLFGETRARRPISDEQALTRYRYLLRTAPPDAIEQAHAEAFAQLTPAQRAQVLQQLSAEVPPSQRPGTPGQTDPQALACLATRAEMRHPGTLERALGGGGIGVGGMFAGSLLSSIAGAFIGTAIAHQFLGAFGDGSAAASDEMASAAPHSSAEGGEEDVDGGGGDFGGDCGDV